MKAILQLGEESLRRGSKAVPHSDIASERTQLLISEMQEILKGARDGIALAAPQIGVNLRLFVVSEKAFSESTKGAKELVYINPKIVKRSATKSLLDEGCLSVKNIFGKIKRYDKVTVEAVNEQGEKFTRGATGLLAEIFQHEIDHLEGIIFVDKATDLIEIKDEQGN